MFVLTDCKTGGVYAVRDDKTIERVVQIFVDKDDAITYNVHLEALGKALHVTETENDIVDKLCGVHGHAYTIVQPGEFVIPRFETMQSELNPEEE